MYIYICCLTLENMFINPVIEISKYGKKLQEDKKIFLITLEDEESKIKRLDMAINECVKTGGWIIIENPQFIKRWPKESLKRLYQIKDANVLKEESDYWEDYNLNIPEAKNSPEIFIHANFRMWLICESDQMSCLPEALIFDAIKLTPKLSDLRQTFLACNQVQKTQKSAEKDIFKEVSILHGLMTHNDFRHNYNW